MRKWAAISGILGAVWMLVVIWAGSLRLAVATSYPALWLTNLVFERTDVSVSGLNALLVLSSAIQWAAIGLLFRAIHQKISK